MKNYLFIVGDTIKGCHTDLDMVKVWRDEVEKLHQNVTIALVIEP